MNNKLIIAFVAVLLIGVAIGYFSGPRIDGTFEIEKTVDSLNVVNKVKDEVLESLIKEKTKNIKNAETNLKQRDEDFKTDTIPIPTDELIQRARAIIATNQ